METAEQIAVRCGCRPVRAGHIMAAIRLMPQTLGGEVLSGLAADAARLTSVIRRRCRTTGSGAVEVNFAQRILDHAGRIARAYHAARIDSGHVLLALLADRRGESREMLVQAGIDSDEVRRQVVDRLGALWNGEDEPLPRVREEDVEALLSYSDVPACPVCSSCACAAAKYCGQCGAPLRLRFRGGATRLEEFLRECGLAVAARAQGRKGRATAIRHLRRARRLIPGDPRPLLELARTYAVTGRRRRALTWYRRTLRIDAACVPAWVEGAECFSRYAFLRRTRWLARAARIRPHDADIAARVERESRRLRRWERRWFVPGGWSKDGRGG